MLNSNQPINLLERTKTFAKDSRIFVSQIQKTISNIEDGKQLVRSSGSVAANAIEADEALSSKDFVMRAKIVRKEAKESSLWLELVNIDKNDKLITERIRLIDEAKQIKLIYNSIIQKVEKNK